MPDKALAFAQMADQKAMEITRSYQSWTAFLTTAARLYKYPYHEQLLIYAQRPDATACAEFGLWTETMRRYVRRGSKGIGLVDMSGNAPRLRYVFDISDTGGREDSRRPFIWQLEEKHLDAVQVMLAIRYDEDAPYFPQQLELIANKLAAEYWEDHKRDILDIIDDTYLSDYDEYNVGVTFRKAAGVSIAYMLMARCDLEPEESFSHEDFMSIFDFNTPQAVFALGTAVSQISQRVLRQIEAVVKNAERSIENERTDLHPERGLSDPEPDVGRNGNQAPGQVRDDAETIPDGAATDPVQFPAAQREITEPSAGNRADSADPPGTDDEQNAPGSGPDRENESGESDGVGGPNERTESPGRGNPAEPTDIQLTEESEDENAGGDPPAFSIDGQADLPDDGAAEDGNWNDLALPQPDTLQTSLFDAENFSAETLSAPLPPRQGIRYAQQIVDEALAVGGFDINSRLTIAAYFMKNKPMEDNARFLAEHYGVNGTGFYLNDRQYAMWYDQNGIRLASGETSQGLSSQLISWEQAAQRIRELLDEGRYMTQDELDRAPEFELEELASDLVFFRRDLSEEAKEQGYLRSISAISEERISFDEMQSRLVALMKQPETLVALENELSQFMTAYAENRDLLRFRYHKQGKYLQRLQDLQRDPLTFTAAPDFDLQHRYFISLDQIDRILHGGNDSTEYRLAVYAYFRNHPLPKDQENYMKNYHGQYSGQSSINYDLLYTTKSFSYRRTYRDAPPAEIEWKWNKAAKRIQTLIQQGRFLTDADRAAMPDYERKQIAMQIVRAFSDAPPEIQQPFGHNDILEFWDAVKEVQPQLTDPQRIEEIYRSLVSLTEMTLPSDRHLTTRQQTLQTMTDFIEGKYGLFGERVQPVFSFSIFDNQDKTEERADNIPAEQSEEIPPSLDSPSAADAIQEDLPQDAPAPIHRAFSQDDIDAALLEWNGSSESKQAVVRYMLVHARDREAAAWLRGEYGDDLPAFPVTAGGAAGDVSWTKVQRRIAQLIREGRYLTEEKQDDISAPVPEEKQTEKPAKRIAQTMDELLTPLTLEQVIEYNSIKEHYPDAWVGYEQMGNYLFFGEEAKQVSEILGTHVFEKEFPGGKISFTGFPASRWYSSSKKLWSKGHDVYLAGETDDGTHTEVKHYLARDYLPIHDTVMIDGREFQIDQVDFQHDKVSLLDMTLLRESRYPMFRVESIENARYYWEKTEETIDLSDKNMDGQILSSEMDRESESPRVLVPEDSLLTRAIDLTENDRQEAKQDHHAAAPAAENREKAENFRITDLTLGQVGQKSKFRANLNAIYVLKLIESENRQATPEEQEVLSRYVGWGGIADAFDESKTAWAKEYAELKDTLTPEEYSAARASTLNAHYTSPTVIQAMYEALGNMGFQTGNILEPAMGVGNFFGMLPETMRDSKLYGVELDSISGRIARQLYPNADIRVAGFETTDRRDFYDLAVGNVPFGNYKVHDRAYDKLGFNIHNYFFAKSLDQVRPGGIVAFVTSRYTMDAKSPEVRKYLAQRADLLGAIRLPNNAFKANAGTDVTTDIIFLQKRDRPMDIEPDWVHLGETEDGIPINSYYVDHPSMVLGTMAWDKSMYGDERETTCNPIEGAQLSEQLSEAIRSITGSYQAAELPDLAEGEEISDSIPADPSVKNYSYTVVDGEVYYRQNSVMVRPALNQTAQERVKGMVALRDCVHRLMDAQVDDEDEAVIRARQAELNTMYDRFTRRYGLINSRGNALAFADDPSYYLLCSLEILDEDGKLERKADMFTKRTIRQRHEITHVDTAVEALAVSIGERACVDLEYMASLMGGEDKIPQIVRDLHGVIFKDPETGPFDMENEETRYKGWQNADEYLSGNVRQKLRIARQAAEQNPQFQVNVTSLETVQPKDLDASEIDVRLGATWVDKQYIEQFMYELFKTPESLQHYDEWGGFNRDAVIVQFSEYTAEWRIANKSAISSSDVAAYTTYGTEDMSAYEILEHTLNLRDVRIFETVEDAEGHERRVVNAKRTTLAQQKQQAIKDAFRAWIWNDPERRMALMSKYNEVFNSTRPREYDGQHIVFTGMTPEISLREHQRNAIAHILYGGNTLLAHQVGAGKTFEMVAAVMESKRLGLCQKAMIVVPNHLTEQWLRP